MEAPVKDRQEIKINLNRKDLTKLFKGQELYSIKGIKTKFNGERARLNSISSKKDHILKVELKDRHFAGSKNFILHSELQLFETYNSLKWFLKEKKIFWVPMKILDITFEDKIQKSFVSIDIPTKEVIEFNGNRFLQILSYSPYSTQFEIEEADVLKKINLSCYDYDYESLMIIKIFMEDLKVNLESFDAIKIIPNPITNKLQFVIDFSYSSKYKNSFTFDRYVDAIDKVIPVNKNTILQCYEYNMKDGKFRQKTDRKKRAVRKK